MALSRNKKPLYMQIRSILKDRILHGAYPVGMLIPSEPQLEQEFNVSKITVRNAIQELVQEGYLEKGSGIGTRVIRNTSVSKLSKGKSFTEILVEEGHRIRKKLLKSETIDNDPGSEPYRLFGARCLLIQRLYYLDDVPYIYYSHYLTTRSGDLAPEDLDEQSLYGLLEERDIGLVDFRDQFEVTAAPDEVAELLELEPRMPLLRRSRYSREPFGEVVEYSIGYYNTALQSYLINYDA
ncbi:GntR family transcriptional regulator [Cohnella terricola]|uniref:GntR family transcriptional regulator n=1 Tax=Cohnella terricola TaxID=1289167 RepID=A0A559JJD2_9BACL|nr:GntR family transcriptional regulator [Cohnella terricola]TVX99980.1 GntR family transcriptional regulator [Cohnella terricola]